MAYTKQTWSNSSGDTAVSAARLGYMENGIEAAAADADTAQADATTALANAATAQATATTALSNAATAQATGTAAVAKSTATSKGDLLVATGAATVVRLGVGTDGRMLEGDAAQATGMKWGRKFTSSPTAPSGPTTGDIWVDRTNGILAEYSGSAWVTVANLGTPANVSPSLVTQSFAHVALGGITINLALGHTVEVTLTANINAAHTLTGMANGDVVSVIYLASGASRSVSFSSTTAVAGFANPGVVSIAQNKIHRATFIRHFGSVYLYSAEAVTA